MFSEDIDDLKAKRLCCNCVQEAYLSDEIRRLGTRKKCDFCGKARRSYTLGVVAERVRIAFEQHYVRTSDHSGDYRYGSYDWDRSGDPVVETIRSAANIPEPAANDIQAILEEECGDRSFDEIGEETEFSSGSYYEENRTDDEKWQKAWSDFEQSLKSEARFFSRRSAEHLASIFNGIEEMGTRAGHPLIKEAGPDKELKSFFRARVFQSDDKMDAALCRPDQQLGPPTSVYASAGRMNARGISVFYGANEPRVAIAEVRPPVGSKVLVAQFEIIRPMRLLDLVAFKDIHITGSVFDKEFAGRLERAMFLKSLSDRITRPVMPNDEDFEYLPTQAISDFLATEASVPLDGILFPSVQAAGNALNVVLFHKSARVETLLLPNGTTLEARQGNWEEEGWVTEYGVWEEAPPAKEAASNKAKHDGWPDFAGNIAFPWEARDNDPRNPTLRVVLNSVKVHHVRWVRFDTEEFEVERHRREKIENPGF